MEAERKKLNDRNKDQPRTKTLIASEHAGVNTNILSDEVEVDPLSGNAVLNGIPVVVEKAVNE